MAALKRFFGAHASRVGQLVNVAHPPDVARRCHLDNMLKLHLFQQAVQQARMYADDLRRAAQADLRFVVQQAQQQVIHNHNWNAEIGFVFSAS